MPSDVNALRNLIEGMDKPQVYPSGEFLTHLIDRMAVHLRDAENSAGERSKYSREMAETYATIYRAVRP